MVTVLLYIIFFIIIYSITWGMIFELQKSESKFSPISGTFMFYIVLMGLCLITMCKVFLLW